MVPIALDLRDTGKQADQQEADLDGGSDQRARHVILNHEDKEDSGSQGKGGVARVEGLTRVPEDLGRRLAAGVLGGRVEAIDRQIHVRLTCGQEVRPQTSDRQLEEHHESNVDDD